MSKNIAVVVLVSIAGSVHEVYHVRSPQTFKLLNQAHTHWSLTTSKLRYSCDDRLAMEYSEHS